MRPLLLVYARNSIPVYWIVNLKKCQIEVYTEPYSTPRTSDYRQRRNSGSSETLPVVLDDVEVGTLAVKELLP